MDKKFNENQLEGRNAVLEVLKSGRDIEKIIVQKGNVEGTIRRIVGIAKEKGVVVQEVVKQKLDEMSQTKNHQGVIAIVSEHEYADVEDIINSAESKGEKPVQEVVKQKLDEMSQTKNHQGVIAIVSEHEYADVEDIINSAESKGEKPLIIILDNITDPHNLGAIIRTAECAGAHGVIIPKRRSVGLTAVVGKTSGSNYS